MHSDKLFPTILSHIKHTTEDSLGEGAAGAERGGGIHKPNWPLAVEFSRKLIRHNTNCVKRELSS